MNEPPSYPLPSPSPSDASASPPLSNPRSHSQPRPHRHNPRWGRAKPSTTSSPPPSSPPFASLTPDALHSAIISSSTDLLSAHLRSEQLHTLSMSANDAFAHLLHTCSCIVDDSPSAHLLVLSLLSHPMITRRKGDRMDLPVVLLTALSQHAGASSAPLPPAICAAALPLLSSLPLSPRSFSLFLSAYQLTLTPTSCWWFIDRLSSRGQHREAAELAMRLDVLNDATDERHRQLLTGLMRGSKQGEGVQMDTLYGYIGSLKGRALMEKWRDWVIQQVAEESGGNNLTAAMRLLVHYDLSLTSFPRVDYLKRKHEVWWMSRMGKSDEFADVIVGHDLKLKRKLIQQLSKHRYTGDLERMNKRISQWGMERDEEVRAILSTLAISPPPPPVEDEEDKEGEVPYYSMPLSSIVFVDDLATLRVASSTLSGNDGPLGFDCEFVPESFHQLGLSPSHTQLVQVACSSLTFVFDLTCLCAGADPELTRLMVDVLMMALGSEQVKIGIGFAEDLRKLRKDFPHLACFQLTVSRYVDLTPLLKDEGTRREGARPSEEGSAGRRVDKKGWKEKQQQRKWRVKGAAAEEAAPSSAVEEVEAKAVEPTVDSPFPSSSPLPPLPPSDCVAPPSSAPPPPPSFSSFTPFVPKVGGLARLCREFVGLRLDKTCQISQWARRPLSSAQLMYAACDAAVQLPIYVEAVRRGRTLREIDIEG